MKRTLANELMYAFLDSHLTAEERTQSMIMALVQHGELPELVFTYADRVATAIEKERMDFIDNDDVIRLSRQKSMGSPKDFEFEEIYHWVKIILRDRGVLKSATESLTPTKFARTRD